MKVDRFAEGSFVVGSEGRVGINYLHDGGVFQPEVGIFSLAGMEHLDPNSATFIKEAARRALSKFNLKPPKKVKVVRRTGAVRL